MEEEEGERFGAPPFHGPVYFRLRPVFIQYIYIAVFLPLLASMRSLSYADDLARAVLSERPMGWKGKKKHFISQSFAKMLAVLANLMANGLNDTGSV